MERNKPLNKKAQNEKIYSLANDKEKKGTLHIFETEKNDYNSVDRLKFTSYSSIKSICSTLSYSSAKIFINKSKLNELRIEVAKIGNTVCGNCVSHLYKNKDDDSHENTQHLIKIENDLSFKIQSHSKKSICNEKLIDKDYTESDNIRDVRITIAEQANNDTQICGNCVSILYKNTRSKI
jgi:hypothetical protein